MRIKIIWLLGLISQLTFAQIVLASDLYYLGNGKSNNVTLSLSCNGGLEANIHATTDYQAYGAHSDTLNTNVATNFSYNGEYQDPSSDLVYLRSRDYDAGTQRFITQDSANVWNKYNFADSNPIMNIDPSGHMPAWLNYTLNIAGFFGGIAAAYFSAGTVPLIAAVFGAASGATGFAAQALRNDSGWQTASLVLGIASMGFDVASGISSAAGGAGEITGVQLTDRVAQDSTETGISPIASSEQLDPRSYNYSPQRLREADLGRLKESLHNQGISLNIDRSTFIQEGYAVYNKYNYDAIVPSMRTAMSNVESWLKNDMNVISDEQKTMLKAPESKNLLLYDFTEQAYFSDLVDSHITNLTSFVDISAFHSAKAFPQLRATVLNYEDPISYSLVDFNDTSLDASLFGASL
ncbi:RHS repeat-associated core domain-containing protein [Cysteiniphilum sp. JM-1]|uniref:RHS repeat-associated core domain-containing protein n=1 Tax=Cysteiniphilum sp. JM-1 TaxID=2610891 RepID=UPI001243D0E8|nr:RHS repeat-associated core domain-containing protein [Cysteiniphilum sp. JM-1]